ncbi:MAG: 16S rRNA (cytosine(1402)-N(4))-methyltransferase RsmH [Candidatus Omnitrophica bacterium]|nr:16S rRNA (cytosine(1402)-N(4))-methyltransferase RsmH [Candidatus Omnitrophota bacterium]
MENKSPHKPVMASEAIGLLQLKNGYKVLDATTGCGGHASFILDKIRPDGVLIGVDRDQNTLKIAEERLSEFGGTVKLRHANFQDFDKVLLSLGIEKIDAALFDLGISSYQIGQPNRGFSFENDGFLDMRMDPEEKLRAYDIVNKYKGEDLEEIIRDYGQERYFRRITGFILEERKRGAINSTRELTELIRHAVGARYRSQRIHPATRTFQALRIAVNNELNCLDKAMVKIADFLGPGKRAAVISFHSLEDRIVKIRFREFEKSKKGKRVTKKPLTPTSEEIRENPRARSAKLRVYESSV